MKQLVIFSASWCTSCNDYKKVIQDNVIPVDNIRVYDVDASPDLAHDYGIRSIPTSLILTDGVETARKTGAMTREVLMKFIGN